MPRRYSAKSKKSSFRRRRPSSKSKRMAYRKKRRTRPKRGTKFGFGQDKNFLSKRAYSKHVYAETIDLTSGTETNVSVYTFSANSLYDPNITGTGHQPMGRDEVAALYGNYHVSGGEIEVTYYSDDSDSKQTTTCPMVGIHIPTMDADGTATDPIADDDNFSELVEAGVIHPQGKKNHMQHAYGSKPITLKRRWSTRRIAKDFLRNPGTLVNNPDIGAASGASPASNLLLQLWAAAPGGGAHVDIKAVVKITYFATWSDPTLVGQS